MTYAKKLPRGIRNNNYLNIRASKTPWIGQNGSDKEGFCIFLSRIMGYRAAFKTLDTYARKYGIVVLKDIIKRWAPPSENKTEAYIFAVCNFTGYEPETRITTKERIVNLVRAMAKVEIGIKWADSIFTEELLKGYEMAHIKEERSE